jgi:acetate kinase
VVLTLNAGSSSLKAALFRDGEALARESIDVADGGMAGAVEAVLDRLGDGDHGDLPSPEVIGHRIVHGGPDLGRPMVVDDALVARLEALVPLAPLHQPAGLACLAAARRRFPALAHVACFDTAFHRDLPEVAQRLPVPRAWRDAGVRRYGFHGLSYQHLIEVLGLGPGSGSAVLAHLGSGASLAAVADGRPVDTTMGLTPTGGLVMATRSGDLDPGVAAWALRTGQVGDGDELARALDHQAGLAGLASAAHADGDLRRLLAARAQDPEAALAVAVLVASVRKHVGAMAAALGGIELLVFTGGVGERSAEVRAEVCDGLGHLGVAIDPEANRTVAGALTTISAPGSRCTVLVVPADEERVIARLARGALDGRRG